jgi:glycosyltransferase involved in cell wall biosynthesis
MERRESAGGLAHAVILVNVEEAAEWRRRHGGTVVGIPNGISRAAGAWHGEGSSTILFAGTLDYPPNVESARTLAVDVLPEVRRAVPAAHLELVGRRPDPRVAALAGEHVAVLADVPSMAVHYQGAAVAAFPGNLGSGMRNCVTEALVHGCPVVASPHSARNLPPGPHLTLADDDAMAGAIAALLTDRARLRDAADAAARFGAEQDGPAEVAARYAEVIEQAARER